MGETVNKRQQIVDSLIHNPDELLLKKPFTRGAQINIKAGSGNVYAEVGEKVTAHTPQIKRRIIQQEEFALELDPACHKILFDENVPSITMKLKDGTFMDTV